MTFALGKKTRGICQKCGAEWKLSQLKEEFVKGQGQGNAIGPCCWDPDHPQNWFGTQRIMDNEAVRNPEPEQFDDVRTLVGFDPVGAAGNVLTLSSGRVAVNT